MKNDKSFFHIIGINRINRMVEEAMEIEREEALKAGAPGYLHRGMTLCSMPYKDLKEQTFYTRSNGTWELEIFSSPKYGLPYGNIPRLLYMYLGTEAVRTQSPQIALGNSLSEFLEKLGLIRAGGARGDITRLNNQIKRMFYSKIIITYTDRHSESKKSIDMVDGLFLLWDTKNPSQGSLWESYITLNKSYFDELIKAPVPIDLRIVKELKSSALELDIYFWLSHRMFYLHKPTLIPYDMLRMQFGSEYKRLRDFKKKFLVAFKKVLIFWPDLNFSEEKKGIRLSPSRLLIKPQPKKKKLR